MHHIFVHGLDLDVDPATDVVASGVLDSLAFVQLLAALESEFGIKVDIATLDLEDFSTVSSIAQFVVAAREGAA